MTDSVEQAMDHIEKHAVRSFGLLEGPPTHRFKVLGE